MVSGYEISHLTDPEVKLLAIRHVCLHGDSWLQNNPTRAILQLTRDFKGQQGCHFKENSAISGLLKEEVEWLFPAIADISMFRRLLLLILKRCMK